MKIDTSDLADIVVEATGGASASPSNEPFVSALKGATIIRGWPRMMTVQTLVEYLDMGSLQTLHRYIKANPTFPVKDARTRRWDKEAIDSWVGEKCDKAPAAGSSWREEFSAWAESR